MKAKLSIYCTCISGESTRRPQTNFCLLHAKVVKSRLYLKGQICHSVNLSWIKMANNVGHAGFMGFYDTIKINDTIISLNVLKNLKNMSHLRTWQGL